MGVPVADLSTKAWAAQQLPAGGERVAGFVRLQLVRNAGISFGLSAQRPLLVLLLSLVASAGCVGWLLLAPRLPSGWHWRRRSGARWATWRIGSLTAP